MAHKKRKKLSEEEIFLKGFKKANREIEMERNDGKWIATHRVWKNKKAYNRKRDRKIDSDGLFYFGRFSFSLFTSLICGCIPLIVFGLPLFNPFASFAI